MIMATNTAAAYRAPTGTASGSGVTVDLDRYAAEFLDSLTRARRNTTTDLDDAPTYVQNLIRRIENDRAHPHFHVVAVLRDAFDRGGSREDLEAPGWRLIAMVRAWFSSGQPADLEALCRAETEAQHRADLAVFHDIDWRAPSQKSLRDAAERLDAHRVCLENFALAIRTRLVA